jgi:hypothetical protein
MRFLIVPALLFALAAPVPKYGWVPVKDVTLSLTPSETRYIAPLGINGKSRIDVSSQAAVTFGLYCSSREGCAPLTLGEGVVADSATTDMVPEHGVVVTDDRTRVLGIIPNRVQVSIFAWRCISNCS